MMSSTMHGLAHQRKIADAVKELRRGHVADTTLIPQCMSCDQLQRPGVKMSQCSVCKAVYYCNITCANQDWVGNITPQGYRNPSHKSQCKQLKDSMTKKPDMQAIARQFPWVREQKDGSFDLQILRASLDILGTGPQFGWWTEQPCCNHAPYIWGTKLLECKHYSEKQGWKLPNNQIPWLNFTAEKRLPPAAGVRLDSWTSYYKWRGLSLQSPACLLLHWPLSVYKLLDLLHLVPSEPLGERRKLTVHIIGVEKELDFLPIYGELALLLPNTDLDLIFFGQGVATLLDKAKEKPSCLAMQEYAYTYTAPPSFGASTVRISLSKNDAFWDGFGSERTNKPDALIACNAGLSTYEEWRGVCIASRAFAIPFAVTDYMEISLCNDIDLLLTRLPLFLMILPGIVKKDLSAEELARVTKPGPQYEIRLNPFMSPGPRPSAAVRVPTAVNGFTMVIIP